jgi:hypothetical protein
VLILIFLLLLSIFIPFIRKTRETDHRVRCQSNLRAIGAGLQNYSKANQGDFPRVVYDAANYPMGYFAYTGPFAPSAFAGMAGSRQRCDGVSLAPDSWRLRSAGEFRLPSTSDYPDA